MAMNKKAFLFTIMSLIFLGVVSFYLGLETDYAMNKDFFRIEKRVASMDYFISTVEDDIERGMYISGFRSLVGIQNFIASNGTFLTDRDQTIREIMLNGSINGDDIPVMANSSFSLWLEKIAEEAQKNQILFDYSVNDMVMNQSDPWLVQIVVSITMNVTDTQMTASWSVNRTIPTFISIIGFDDPFYDVYSNGSISNQIQRTPYTTFAYLTDTRNLTDHINNSYYKNTTLGPSYIMRLEGNFSSSPYGIESTVDLRRFQELSDLGIIPLKDDTSIIDWIYLSNESSHYKSYLINETPYNWIQLDNVSGHLLEYDVNHLAQI